MKRVILAILLSLAACGAAGAQGADAAEEKRRDIRRLLELSRGAEMGSQIVKQSIDELRKGLFIIPEAEREKIVKVFEEEMMKEFSPAKMIELTVPIYEKHLTAEDVKALIDFYQTPVGRKMLDALPLIMREAYEVGSVRGREAGVRALARVAELGLIPAPGAAGDPPKPAPAPAKRPAPRRRRN